MARPQDRRALAAAVIADLLDILPPLPGLNTLGSIIDALTIQYTRTAYPESRAATAIGLTETIEFPIPFLPNLFDLLPSHTAAVAIAERARRRAPPRAPPRALPFPVQVVVTPPTGRPPAWTGHGFPPGTLKV